MKLVSNDSISLFSKGKLVKIDSTDPRFKQAYKLLVEKNDEKGFLKLAGTPVVVAAIKAVQKDSKKKIFKVKDGSVFFGEHEVRGSLAAKVESMLRHELPLDPFVKFCEKGLKNPSRESFEALYDFLANNSIAITPEGNFIGYKYVQANYYSVHGNPNIVPIKGKSNANGQIYNGIGEEIQIKRSQVDASRQDCSSLGLHVGGPAFIRNYGGGDSYRTVLIEVDPKDAVTVPSRENQKLRVCRYKVVGEFEKEIETPVAVVDRKTKKVNEVKGSQTKVKTRNQRVKDYVAQKAADGLERITLKSVANSLSPDYIKVNELRSVLRRQGWTIEGSYVIL